MSYPFRTLSMTLHAACCLIALLAIGTLRAGSFSTDFNSGTPSGSTTYGNATVDTSGGVGDSGVLKLTPAAVNQQGSFIIDDLDPGQRIQAFTASFKVRIGGGTTPPGDGMSFCFGTDLPNASFNEDGPTTSGFVITFDAYDNSVGDNSEGPEVRLRFNGSIIERRKITNQFRTDTNYVPVTISYTPSGTLTLVFNGVTLYTNFFVFGPLGTGARFGFGARCGGGADETHWIDDLTITTTPATHYYVKGSVTPSPASEVSPSTPITVTVSDFGGFGVNSNSFTMNLNGANVVPTVTRNPVSSSTTATYQPPNPLPASSINHVKVSFGYINDPSIDTVNYDFTVAHTPIWSLAPLSRSYLLLDADTSGGTTPLYRSVAYNALSNHIYIISRTAPNSGLSVNVLDAKTGADLWQLNTSGIVPANTIMLAFMGVADDGALYASNISTTNGVTIYRWDNGDSSTVPKVVFAGVLFPTAPSSTRWGDALAVRGSGAGTQIILDAGGGFTNAAILTATDASATNFTTTGYIHTYPGSDAIGRSIQFGPTNSYFIKRHSSSVTPPVASRALQLNRYDTAPNTTILASVSDYYGQVGPITVDLTKNLAAGIMFVTNAASHDHLVVWDISNFASPLQIAQYDFPPTHQKNNNCIGQVVFSSDRIFAVDGNNGVIAVPAYPPFQPGLSIAQTSTKAVLSWTPSIPEYKVQYSTAISPTSWLDLGLPITTVSGQNYVTNTLGIPAKFYRLSSQ